MECLPLSLSGPWKPVQGKEKGRRETDLSSSQESEGAQGRQRGLPNQYEFLTDVTSLLSSPLCQLLALIIFKN